MNAAFENHDEIQFDFEMDERSRQRGQERFRMARRNYLDRTRKRPQQFNGIHRRRRKKIRL
jgi:hypothetical protein